MVPKPEWTFTSADLYSASEAVDTLDFPAISFQLRPKATDRFGEFTGAHVKEQMAIVFDDEIVSCATIIEKLPGQAQISGRFTEQQVKAMITVLRSGELPSKPALVSIEQVPARH
jgi:preprotein translocase subunit SecD